MPDSTSEQLKFAGDVNIDSVQMINSRGLSQNITEQVLAIEYYEDIFQPFLTGQLAVRESLDLPNLFQLMGEEFIEIEFSTPTLDKPIKNTFYVFKMTDRATTGDTNVVYNLHFISIEAVIDMNKKLSKVFKGKMSDTVRTLLKDTTFGLETTKPVNIEETANQKTWISAYWSPQKNLEYCTNYATTHQNVPNFLFYENNNGFNFISLESLYAQAPVQTFTKDKYTRDFNADGTTNPNPEAEYQRIIDLSIPESHNFLDNLKAGMYSSRAVTFDITTKQYTAKNYDHFSQFNRRNHLNENPPNSLNSIFRPMANLMYRPRMTANFSGTGDNSNYITLQERMAAIKAANAHKIEISVPGRTDYCVGQKVAVQLTKNQPVAEQDEDQDMVDRMYSGYYIISAINHVVNRQRHECHMELIKDSLQANPNAVGTQ